MSKSTAKKPRKDYPLTPRGDGRWQKKVRGKVYYFRGTANEALDEWLRIKDDVLSGRDPRPDTGQLIVKELLNRFLDFKRDQVSSGELSERSWRDYKSSCAHVDAVFGKTRVVETLTATDFAKLRRHLADGRGPVTLKNEVTRIRAIFKFAYDYELIDQPLRCIQTAFAKPAKAVLRKVKAANGENLFARDEVRALLDAANPKLKAMILLGINAGLGNADVAHLEPANIKGGWLNYPRRKTGVERRAKLWQETLDAIDAAGGLPFRTKYGARWVDDKSSDNALSKEMRKLLNKVGITTKGLGLYTLRHTFRTVADETRDRPAIDLVMGHSDDSMASHYVERIDDARLVAVSNYVHSWLYDGGENGKSD